MKRILKSALSITLCIMMLLGTISGVGLIKTNATGFSTRTSAPTMTGYYETCGSFNPYTINIGNCVWYAFGRAYEMLGTRPNINTSGNAYTWYINNKSSGAYPYGSTPQVGAIACWDSYVKNKDGELVRAGHVAIVEEVYSDGTMLISESSWGTFYFRTHIINSNGLYLASDGTFQNWNQNFQGFIYLPVEIYTTPTVTISIDKCTPGGTATFRWNAPDATSVHFYIYKTSADGVRQEQPYFQGQYSNTTTSYTRMFSENDNNTNFVYKVVAHYPGSVDISSEWQSFTIAKPTVSISGGNNQTSGKPVEFKWWAVGASFIHLYIYKPDGSKFFEGQFKPGDTYKRVFYDKEPTNYTYQIKATYPSGTTYNSELKTLNISVPKVFIEMDTFTVGEIATFSWNVQDATSVHLYVESNGKLYFTGEFQGNSATKQMMYEEYTYYIVAHYSTGDIESEHYSITLNKPMVSVTMDEYIPGKTATFSWNAPGANSVHLYVNDASGKRYFEGQFSGNSTTLGMGEGYFSYGIVAHYPSGVNVESEWHELYVNNHSHSYILDVVKSPTCTAAGVKTFTCSCGDSYTEEILATGHSFTNYIYNNDATTEKDGTETAKCNNCNEIDTRVKTGTKLIPGHTHSFVKKTTQKATCESDGINIFTCTCGNSYTEAIPAIGHTEVSANNAIDATCSKEGKESDTICSVCGVTLTTGKSIAKLEHTYTVTKTTPTCTERGNNKYTCSACGYSYEDNIVSATGHTDKNNDGLCDECGEGIKVDHIHNYVDATVTKQPDCTNDGISVSTCACGDSYSTVIPATGHKDTNKDGYCDVCKVVVDASLANPCRNAKINVASVKTVDYRTKVTVKATATGVTSNYYLAIYINGKQVAKGTNTEVTYEAGQLTSDINYTVKVIDAKGNVQKDIANKDLAKDSKITVNASFFAKIIAFFKGLFGMLPTVTIKP